jgi:hypothetical protein
MLSLFQFSYGKFLSDTSLLLKQIDLILEKKKLGNIIEKEKEKEKDNSNNIIVADNNILQIGSNKTKTKIQYILLKNDIRKKLRL